MMIWISVTSLLGTGPADQINLKWQLTEKMLLMTILAYMLTNTRERLDQLIVVCALSVAFFGVKGGIFSLLTGGGSRVYGPDGTMIGDNNDLGVALTMMLPLLFYIRDRYRQPYLKWPMLALIGFTFIGDIFTYSRGALLALCSMGAMLWLRSRHKFRIMLLIAVAAVGVWRFAPPEWTERMGTIETYQDDDSAESRIHVWRLAWAMAQARPIFGAGFHWAYDPDKVNQQLWDSRLPRLEKPRAAHSIWFEMLGDHGFVGLAIFLAILASTFLDARWLIRRSQRDPDLLWANNLGRMLQVSLVGFCAGGSFATLAMYDGLYAVVIVAAAGRLILAAELASRSAAAAAAVGKGFIGVAPPGGAFRPQPTG
jgi:probable O-glycosylation ligase (exosortase A-associated)